MESMKAISSDFLSAHRLRLAVLCVSVDNLESVHWLTDATHSLECFCLEVCLAAAYSILYLRGLALRTRCGSVQDVVAESSGQGPSLQPEVSNRNECNCYSFRNSFVPAVGLAQ